MIRHFVVRQCLRHNFMGFLIRDWRNQLKQKLNLMYGLLLALLENQIALSISIVLALLLLLGLLFGLSAYYRRHVARQQAAAQIAAPVVVTPTPIPVDMNAKPVRPLAAATGEAEKNLKSATQQASPASTESPASSKQGL